MKQCRCLLSLFLLLSLFSVSACGREDPMDRQNTDDSKLTQIFLSLPDIYQIALDYRPLTQFSLPTDTWPIPRMMEILEQLFEMHGWAYKQRLTLDISVTPAEYRLVDPNQKDFWLFGKTARLVIHSTNMEYLKTPRVERFLNKVKIIDLRDPHVAALIKESLTQNHQNP